MEMNLNVPDWLKIPLKVFLPALWLFSGIMILLPDEWLQRLYLLEWSQEHGFAFGLTFAISSCLLLVYLFFFLKKKISIFIHKLTFKRNTFKKITSLSIIQQAIIYKLYNTPTYTAQLDYNQPVVQGLMSLKYIYMGGQQAVSIDVFSHRIPAFFTLQPFVYQALDHYRPKVEKKIDKMERKMNKVKDPDKKQHLAKQLQDAKERYEVMYNGGLA